MFFVTQLYRDTKHSIQQIGLWPFLFLVSLGLGVFVFLGFLIWYEKFGPPCRKRCAVLCDGTIVSGCNLTTGSHKSSLYVDGAEYGCWVRECDCAEKEKP